uniref:Uncharacterized protein n=1 Tax=Arundo donax TaxID=35708 RepID=A0A0A9DY93_ARUDO
MDGSAIFGHCVCGPEPGWREGKRSEGLGDGGSERGV